MRTGDGSAEAAPGDAPHWLVERTVGDSVETIFASEDPDAVAAFLASRVISQLSGAGLPHAV
jgi:hypothetical protein